MSKPDGQKAWDDTVEWLKSLKPTDYRAELALHHMARVGMLRDALVEGQDERRVMWEENKALKQRMQELATMSELVARVARNEVAYHDAITTARDITSFANVMMAWGIGTGERGAKKQTQKDAKEQHGELLGALGARSHTQALEIIARLKSCLG